MSSESQTQRRLGLVVHGVVQGVGFRPFVHRAARSQGLGGSIRNTPQGVRIEVQGPNAELERFVDTILRRHPPHAKIDRLETEELSVRPENPFRILDSESDSASKPAIPPDLAVCSECLNEVTTPGERRYQYPFTNCTHCGPRYSIVEGSPYDRERTSMRAFPMCPACRAEYEDPSDRRFHAQPIACPTCGPQLTLLNAGGNVIATKGAALDVACDWIRNGRIVALKGLGGFQFVVDATQDEAVQRLRARKRREEKPFALMLASVEAARCYCAISDDEAAVLTSPACPIVLLQRRVALESGKLPPIVSSVAPGNPRLGVMLPNTPLHHLMMRELQRPIVCTSGNVSEEPMCIEIDEAKERLSGIADAFLTHDRPIVRQVDDSVVRVGPDGPRLLRRARGYTPAAIELGSDGPSEILAVGGHLKNTVALRIGSQVVLSQHVGDLDYAEGRALLARTVTDLLTFHGVTPTLVACDAHPDYASTQYAVQYAAASGIPLIRVQHHHAHVLSVMAEHRLDGHVLGLAWDGSGFGADGTVWGGEALLCDANEYRRVAHLRPFRLPGGEQAVREPRRAALGLLYEIMGDSAMELVGRWFSPTERRVLSAALRRGVMCPITTSMGRLFDAVACLAGLYARSNYEGQAAMALEYAADAQTPDRKYPLPLSGGDPAVADWEPMIRRIVADLRDGVPVGVVAASFHAALGTFAVEAAQRAALPRVVLSGGCFQNALLGDLVRSRLEDAGFQVFENRLVPANDGGLALGQILAASVPTGAWLSKQETVNVSGCAG